MKNATLMLARAPLLASRHLCAHLSRDYHRASRGRSRAAIVHISASARARVRIARSNKLFTSIAPQPPDEAHTHTWQRNGLKISREISDREIGGIQYIHAATSASARAHTHTQKCAIIFSRETHLSRTSHSKRISEKTVESYSKIINYHFHSEIAKPKVVFEN